MTTRAFPSLHSCRHARLAGSLPDSPPGHLGVGTVSLLLSYLSIPSFIDLFDYLSIFLVP